MHVLVVAAFVYYYGCCFSCVVAVVVAVVVVVVVVVVLFPFFFFINRILLLFLVKVVGPSRLPLCWWYWLYVRCRGVVVALRHFSPTMSNLITQLMSAMQVSTDHGGTKSGVVRSVVPQVCASSSGEHSWTAGASQWRAWQCNSKSGGWHWARSSWEVMQPADKGHKRSASGGWQEAASWWEVMQPADKMRKRLASGGWQEAASWWEGNVEERPGLHDHETFRRREAALETGPMDVSWAVDQASKLETLWDPRTSEEEAMDRYSAMFQEAVEAMDEVTVKDLMRTNVVSHSKSSADLVDDDGVAAESLHVDVPGDMADTTALHSLRTSGASLTRACEVGKNWCTYAGHVGARKYEPRNNILTLVFNDWTIECCYECFTRDIDANITFRAFRSKSLAAQRALITGSSAADPLSAQGRSRLFHAFRIEARKDKLLGEKHELYQVVLFSFFVFLCYYYYFVLLLFVVFRFFLFFVI